MNWLILAQATVEAFEWVGPIIQLVQFGGFTAMAWYLLAVREPKQTEANRIEREKWLDTQQKIADKFETLVEKCIKCIEESNARNR